MNHIRLLSIAAFAGVVGAFGLALHQGLATAAEQADQRPISERRALMSNGTLSVQNVAGLIQIEGWDQNEMALTGNLGGGVERLEITGSSSDLKLNVKLYKGPQRLNGEARLLLKVPTDIALKLDGTSADIKLAQLSGNVEARTVSGDLDVDVASQKLNLQTVSGDLQIKAPRARDVELNTVSGDINAEGLSGMLVAESVSGDIEVQGGSFSKLLLKSVSGDVGVEAATAEAAQVKAESLSGDVRFNTIGSLNAEVSLKSFSGDKHCSLEHQDARLEGRRTLYKVGDGKGRVTLTSFSGDVRLEGQ